MMRLTETVEKSVLSAAFDAAQELGVDLKSIVGVRSLESNLLESIQYGWEDFSHLIGRLVDEGEVPRSYFVIARHMAARHSGILEYLFTLSPDLRSALRKIEKFSVIYSPLSSWNLQEQKGTARLIMRLSPVDEKQHSDTALVGILHMHLGLQERLAGIDLKPSIHLTYEPSSFRERRAFEEALNVPVLFGQDINAISFPSPVLMTPMPHSDAGLLEIVEEKGAKLLEQRRRDLTVSERVRIQIRQQLGTNACNMLQVSKQLNVHQKTLARLLKREGTTFRGLLADERFECARYFLQHSKIGLTQLAEILGYSDVPAMSRAIKKRFGIPPSEVRKRASDQTDSPSSINLSSDANTKYA